MQAIGDAGKQKNHKDEYQAANSSEPPQLDSVNPVTKQ
jgi:hypothetical protein